MRESPGRRRGEIGILLVALLVILALSPSWLAFSAFPRHLRAFEGEDEELLFGLPLKVYLSADRPGINVDGKQIGPRFGPLDGRQSFRLSAAAVGSYRLRFCLLGLIPVREMVLEVLPGLGLVPGGQSIGIMVRADGVLVVGYRAVTTPSGRARQPGRDAGLAPGDLILTVNGEPVMSEDDLTELVDRAGRQGQVSHLGVRRDGRLLTLEAVPALDRETGQYRIGLWVRDGTAGVGTLTFYHPSSKVFAALGHVVTDVDTNLPVDIRDGAIVDASVARIRQGRRGYPGEKVGHLRPEGGSPLGVIHRNTELGIVGSLNEFPLGLYDQPIPLALVHQVRRGPAQILTVVDGDIVESFEVDILRADVHQRYPAPKGLTIRITDRRLLARTGGIVQGMSGSPIIQQGRLVGAVTHVFVTDPTRGYGVFAEWMALEAGLVGLGDLAGAEGAGDAPAREPARAAVGGS
ncbi:MAG: SpoIVB peptidase [bacterium]|nr:SpoIVB peptidase [bacterium]